MTPLAFCPLLLVLLLQHGTGTHGSITLETLPSDVKQVTCTGDLLCESKGLWCMPGDLHVAKYPVLVPTNISSKTVKNCTVKGCSLCLQVTMDISVAFISEGAENLGSGSCDHSDDYYYQYFDSYEFPESEEEEEDETTAVNLNLVLNNSKNGSVLCANLYISQSMPSSLDCYEVKVSLPLSSVPQRLNTDSVIVGSLVYNCFQASPGGDMTIMSYTVPRYFDVINVTHDFPAPTMNMVVGDPISIGITNATDDLNVTLRRFYNSVFNANGTAIILSRNQRYSFPKSDIVPCLCFQAYYSFWHDAVRTLRCPFTNYSEELTLRRSSLTVTLEDNKLFYELSAPCNVTAEFSLCWRSSDHSKCTEIPHSRKTFMNEQKEAIELELVDPSICVQVSVKGKVLHANCSLYEGTRQKSKEEAIVHVSHHKSTISLCLVQENGCTILYNTTHQPSRAAFFPGHIGTANTPKEGTGASIQMGEMRRGSGFLEKMIVEDVMSEKCRKIWKSGQDGYVYVCSLDKYMRSRWNWSRVLSLIAIACVLLILLLNNRHLKKWIKSMTEEKSLGDIFGDRRVLILYSPDSPAYVDLVQAFASSLRELKLDVVLDLWHHVEMSKMNPLPWYHRQKSLVSEKKGLIILLFSTGAQERYRAWEEEKRHQVNDWDPYSSFGAVLNCVHSDFDVGAAKGLYVVAYFDVFSQNVIPQPFTSVPAYTLPLYLVKLLRELAGDSVKKLGRKQVKRLSAEISDRLQTPMKVFQHSMFRQTDISQTSSDTSESVASDGTVAVELRPLMNI
ncbi:interleukin-17 receptor C isoform X2 [Pseudophryne corroboree]|uniref:interleukin-17 receptor C isoform X2 n=1 Tax=Pseudophryne corroboree TaxID=495146 RepID=UPI003081C6B3